MNKRLLQRFIIFFIPLIFILSFYFLRSYNWNLYFSIVTEDSLLEYLQFLLYLGSGLSILFILFKTRINKVSKERFFLLAISIFFIVISMEEISWGQRLFQFDTPEYLREANTQQETTIHNLKPIQLILHQVYILVGIIGGLVLPYLKNKQEITKKFQISKFFPTFRTSVYFISVSIFYICLQYLSPNSEIISYYVKPQDQEVFETLLSLGIFIGFTYPIIRKFNISKIL